MENVVEKKLKKLIETMIIEYGEEITEKFGEEEYKDALKHRVKVSDIALEDDEIINMLKAEVEDCIGFYLLTKPIKKK